MHATPSLKSTEYVRELGEQYATKSVPDGYHPSVLVVAVLAGITTVVTPNPLDEKEAFFISIFASYPIVNIF